MQLSEIKPGVWSFFPLLICLVSTFYLVGLIWVIQLIQYPLFAKVGAAEFLAFHLEHSERIVLALSIPTLLSLGSSFALLGLRPAGIPDWMTWLNLALCLSFWVVTALVQIPLHTTLSAGFDEALIKTLVDGNWWRTLIWTLQGLLLVVMSGFALIKAIK